MPVYSSPLPTPPPLPEQNAHHTFFSRPEQADWQDYTLYIDAVSGRSMTFRNFKSEVVLGMTALGSPSSQGGLELQGGGLGGGHMVGVFSENSMEFPVLVHSLLGLTTPFALLSALSTRAELTQALRLSRTTHLFVSRKLLAVALGAADDLALGAAEDVGLDRSRVYLLNNDGEDNRPYSTGMKAFPNMRAFSNMGAFSNMRAAARNLPPIGVRPAKHDTLAYVLFSSGTSGLPKAVMIGHGAVSFAGLQSQVLAQAFPTKEPLPTPEGIPVYLAFLPLYHCFSLAYTCFRPLIDPATSVIMAKWNVEAALRAIQRYHVTHLTLVPSIIHQLVHDANITAADFATVRSVTSGAAHLPPELKDRFASKVPQAVIGEGHGMSELTGATIVQPPPGVLPLPPLPPHSLGVLMPGTRAKLIPADNADGADGSSDVALDSSEGGTVGELHILSPGAALGYLGNPAATQSTFYSPSSSECSMDNARWIRTGDYFGVDENGYFFFADRAKDTLKVSGAQVSPREIEDVLLRHPAGLAQDVCVAGVRGQGRTEDERVPRAWVVLAQGMKVDEDAALLELDRWHRAQLSKYKWLRGGMEAVNEIPKSATGKTLRRVLVDRYEATRAMVAKL